jgi:adenosine deaminase CECR1
VKFNLNLEGYLANSIPLVLSPDDPGLLGYSGVTHDFYAALIYWNLNLKSIKKLALNSIEFSSLNSKEKENLTIMWNEKYEKFIENTIKNYNL